MTNMAKNLDKVLTREDTTRVFFGIVALEHKNESFVLKLKEKLDYASVSSITQALNYLIPAGLVKADKDKIERVRVYRVNWTKFMKIWRQTLLDYYFGEMFNPKKEEKDRKVVEHMLNDEDVSLFMKRYLIARARGAEEDIDSLCLDLYTELTIHFEASLVTLNHEWKAPKRDRLAKKLDKLQEILSDYSSLADPEMVEAADSISTNESDAEYQKQLDKWIKHVNTYIKKAKIKRKK